MKLRNFTHIILMVFMLSACQPAESPNIAVQKGVSDEEVTQKISQATADIAKANEELTNKVQSLEEEKKKINEEIAKLKVEKSEGDQEKQKNIEALQAEIKILNEEIAKLKANEENKNEEINTENQNNSNIQKEMIYNIVELKKKLE